jgi:hypothetical protein
LAAPHTIADLHAQTSLLQMQVVRELAFSQAEVAALHRSK